MKCITYGAGLYLHFSEKQIQFAPELHHDLKDKNFAADHETLGSEMQVRTIKVRL